MNMRRYRMNEYQNAIMNTELAYPGTSVCCIGGVMRFYSDIDKTLMIKAAEEFIRRTPVLRLRLDNEGMFYISDDITKPVVCRALEDIESFSDKLMSEPFALANAPLYSFMYIETADGAFGFMKIHHVLGDYTALLYFFKELEKIYLAMRDNTYKKKNPDMRYLETMLDAKAHTSDAARDFFGSRFKKYKEQISSARPRSAVAGMLHFKLSDEDAASVLEFCAANSIKPQTVFHAALAVYMKKTAGRAVSIFGNVLMNRGREDINVFGLYTNTIPVFISAEGSFYDVCLNAERELNESAQFASYPLNKILKDNGLNERCFDIAVSYISMGMMPKLKIAETEKRFNGNIELPLRIHILRRKKAIALDIEYSAEIYTPGMINSFAESLINIIRTGIAGADAEYLTDGDKAAYRELNSVPYIKADTTISRLFSEYASVHGDDKAVMYGEEWLSFKTVENMSNVIAQKLCGTRIAGIAVCRGKYIIPAMLGALKAGAAYMPLASGLPIPDECDAVLTVSGHAFSKDKRAVLLDKLDYSDPKPCDCSKPQREAYRMRTSGSSGAPKTVRISNKSLYLRLKWMNSEMSLQKKILQKTDPCFDVSGWELLCGAFGGCCVMAGEGSERNPEDICREIEDFGIEMIHFVPSMLRLFLEYIEEGRCGSLNCVISSGEALDPKTVRLFYEKLPGAKLYNLYGPTECTIDVTSHLCGKTENETPIGKPVYNTGIYVVTPDGSLAPRGVKGEITVTGDLVGMGYTEGSGGYGEFAGERAYYTGDMGFLGFDGNIYYCGRRDSQVKINGKRIDLAGLEKIILNIRGVTSCAVVYSGGRACAYYSASEPIADIRVKLAGLTDRLPSAIVYVREMPLMNSGKIDRTALLSLRSDNMPEPPANKTEEKLLRMVRSELNKGNFSIEIGVEDNFFDMGLDSLSALSFMLKLREEGFEINVQDIYANPTVRMLAVKANQPKLLIKLGGNCKNGVFLCFPYAGGQPQAFARQARQNEYETLGVNYDFFDDECTVEEMAEQICHELKGVNELRIAAVCVGSAAALETARQLEAAGVKVTGVYIGGSLPAKTRGGKNPWRRAGERGTKLMLSKVTELPERFSTEKFMRDTDRYFKYMSANMPNISAKAYIAFADGDIFTKGYRKKARLWEKYFPNGCTVSVFKTRDHYFMSNIDDVIEKMERGGIYD